MFYVDSTQERRSEYSVEEHFRAKCKPCHPVTSSGVGDKRGNSCTIWLGSYNLLVMINKFIFDYPFEALAVFVRSLAAYEALKSFGILHLPSRAKKKKITVLHWSFSSRARSIISKHCPTGQDVQLFSGREGEARSTWAYSWLCTDIWRSKGCV